MLVRAYAATDFAALTALWDACGISIAYNDPVRDIQRMLASRECQLFVGADGGRLIGSIMVGHEGHRGWVYKLAITPECQGKGHGRALMQHAERWLVARGMPKCHALIRDTNLKVQGFYERLGYEVQPRKLMGKWLNDRNVDMRPAEIDVVTTFLEMTEKPKHPPSARPMGSYALMRLDRPPVGYYRYLYNTVGEPWFWTDRRRMSDDELASEIHAEGVDIFVLHSAGVPAGYVEIDSRSKPQIAIQCFGLMPDFIGRGLGRYLMNWSVDFAWSLGASRLTVDTCTLDHPKALESYQRAGFRPIRREHARIVDPRLEGLIPTHVEPRLPPVIFAGLTS
jgi:GNAT superfamily N-acetyltransferase